MNEYLVIDSDSHVIGTPRTWEFMDPSEEKYRPVLAPHPTDPHTQWWMAETWQRGKGRLRWSCVLPLTSMPDAIEQLRFAREHGAVALTIRPIEGRRLVFDPYFYTLYEEASLLGMAVAIHIGNGNREFVDLTKPACDLHSAGLWRYRLVTVGACEALIESGLPRRFPLLRWGIVEAGATWVPWVLHEARRRSVRGYQVSDDILRELNIFVTMQNDDDIPALLPIAPDNFVIGTDYGHYDSSSQMDAIAVFKRRKDVGDEAKKKLLSDNARRLWRI